MEPALRKARELWLSLNDDDNKARVLVRVLDDYAEGRTGDVSVRTAQAQHAVRAQEWNRALQQTVDRFDAARASGALLNYYASRNRPGIVSSKWYCAKSATMIASILNLNISATSCSKAVY